VFLFTRELAEKSEALLASLRGPVAKDATPLHAVGVLSKCDEYWSQQLEIGRADAPEDPLVTGKRICASKMSNPALARLFYDIVPVCALLAVGAVSLRDADLERLDALARREPQKLRDVLSDEVRFIARDEFGGLAPRDRSRLVDVLGVYGIHVACSLLREGSSADDIRDELTSASGIPQLADLLISHFGQRSLVIRADTVRTFVNTAVEHARRAGLVGPADVIGTLLQNFEAAETVFDRMELLTGYYRGDLKLTSGESDELLRIIGERGESAPERLDCSPTATAAEMEARARSRAVSWRERSGQRGQKGRAAILVARLYERLAQDLRAASNLLGPG
jgi:hypothetical protein